MSLNPGIDKMNTLFRRSLELLFLVGIAATILRGQTAATNLLQLHIAEYNAITMRSTYMITLQYSLLPVFLIYVPVVFEFRRRMKDRIRRELTLWGGYAGILIFGHVWAENLWQQYNNIRYIETELRNDIEPLTSGSRFWCYEPFLAGQRGSGILWWEWVVPILSLVVFILIVVYNYIEDRQLNLWIGPTAKAVKYTGIILCVLLLCALFIKIFNTMELRVHMITSQVCQ
jgi:hypothetical protein